MKTRFLISTTAAALFIGALAFAGTESDKTSPAANVDRLQKRIAELESRVKALEQRLDKPAPVTYAPPVRPRIQPEPPGVSGSSSLDEFVRPFTPPPDGTVRPPKIWGEREFNGWKYYLIPCADRAGASSAPGPPKVVSPK